MLIRQEVVGVFLVRRIVRSSSAFTLIELLVVMAIVAAVGAGIVLSAQPLTCRSRLIAAGEELASLLEAVSARASASRTPQTISFTPGDSKLKIVPLTDDVAVQSWIHHLPHGVIVREVRLNEETVEYNNAQLLMQPSGYMQDATFCLGLKGEKIYVNWQGCTSRCYLGQVNESSGPDYEY